MTAPKPHPMDPITFTADTVPEETITISIIIAHDPSIFHKHWALCVWTWDPNRSWSDPYTYTFLQVKGSESCWCYKPETTHDRTAYKGKGVKKRFLATVNGGMLDTIKDLAGKVPVRNDVKGWNSQDWVLDLLEALDTEKLIDLDARYDIFKARIRKLVERKVWVENGKLAWK